MPGSGPDEPLVTVITPSLNHAEFIEACLDSVAEQTYPHVEHLVLDGGSRDGTLDVLRRHAARPRLRWICEPDRGQAHAINKGLDRARGDVVCWLNADDLFFDHHVLRRVVDVFRERAGVHVVVGDGYHADRDGRLRSPVVLDPRSLNLARMRQADFILQPSAFWRRNDLRLDESFRYAFDWLFFLEMFERGLSVFYLHEFLSIYRLYGSNKTSLDTAARKRELGRILRRNLGPLDPSTLFCAGVYAGYRLAEAARLRRLKWAVRKLNAAVATLTRFRIGTG
jgi:glycosyltransferase involved in cell wall biosynthesis